MRSFVISQKGEDNLGTLSLPNFSFVLFAGVR
jgi:hypothetical protein